MTAVTSASVSTSEESRRFSRALLHVDTYPGAGALNRVAEFTRRRGASVTVAAVLPEVPSLARHLFPAGLGEMLAEQLSANLTRTVAFLRERGGTADQRLLSGQPAVAVIREVLRGGHDLLFRPHGGGESAGSPPPYGPLDMQLLRKCPVPAWFVTDRPSRHIVAAVDPSGEPERVRLDRLIVRLALDIAEGEGAVVTVVHAWQLFAESLLRSRISSEELSAYEEKMRLESGRALDGLVHGLGDRAAAVTTRLVKGNPRDVIPRVVASAHADLVVMGTLDRTGVLGYLIGNTAEAVIRQLRCSLVTLKPEGFVSPVVPPLEPTDAVDEGAAARASAPSSASG